MKVKIFTILLVFIICSAGLAQTLDVPADGLPLNEFVEQNHGEGGKTYVLERNGYYVLSGSVGATGDIAIVAAEGEGARPIIVMGTDDEGDAVGWGMFWLNGNITLKDIHIIGGNQDGGRGAWSNSTMANAGADKTVEIDNCVIDFSDGWLLNTENVPVRKLTMTNNLIRWSGYPGGGPWQGFGVIYKSGDIAEVYIENNTWIECVAPIFVHENSYLGKFWFNHNTVVSHAQFLMRAEYWSEAIFANNLFVDAHFAGESLEQRIGQDPDTLAYGVITVASFGPDDTPPTGFPAENERIFFVGHNANYVSQFIKDFWNNPGFHDTIDWKVADFAKGDNGFLNSRANAMVLDNENYPYFMWDDEKSIFTEDPVFVNYTFDQVNPVLFAKKINGHPNVSPSTAGGSWGIHPEPDFHMEEVAPDYYDLSYTNPFYLIAANGGYPLGDLNWFPELKAQWEADPVRENYNNVVDSIKLGKWPFKDVPTSAVNIRDFKSSGNILHQNYPNPASGYTTIAFTLAEPGNARIRIVNLVGQPVMEWTFGNLDAGRHDFNISISNLPSGIYLYQLETAKERHVKKMQVSN
jgi:hypothetical protein